MRTCGKCRESIMFTVLVLSPPGITNVVVFCYMNLILRFVSLLQFTSQLAYFGPI